MVQMRNPTEVEAERNQSLMIKIQAWDKLIRKQLVMGGKRAFLQLDSLVEFPLLSWGLEESCSLHAARSSLHGNGASSLRLSQEGSLWYPRLASLWLVPSAPTEEPCLVVLKTVQFYLQTA